MGGKGSSVGRPRYVHHQEIVQWVPLILDAEEVVSAAGVALDREALLTLGEIAGRFAAHAHLSGDGPSVADVRNHMPKVASQLGVMRKLLEAPEGEALMFELKILRQFLEDHPQQLPRMLRIDPAAVLDDLETLQTYIGLLQNEHETHGESLQTTFGKSQVSHWDSMVFELAEWCGTHGVSTEFHARAPGAAPPPFRGLIALIQREARWEGLHRELDGDIRAIERALELGRRRQQLPARGME